MCKIVAFIGSPRKNGNVDTIIKEISNGAMSKNVSVKNFYLNNMNIRACQGCLYCRKVHDCAIKDDMKEIYEAIKEAEYVVIGTPVYICQVSAQTKLFLDRLYPLTEIDKSKHTPRFGKKKLVMVFTQAAPFPFLFNKYFKYTAKHLKGMGLEHYKTLVATKAFEKDSSKNNKTLLSKAYKLGVYMAEN
ncbi:flavodoxin family protein [Clostridium senegalense]